MTDFSMEELNAAGGWAFPARHTPEHSPGMTLRDYFAAKAVTGLMERWSPSVITSSSEIARFAYLLADAMLAARCSVTSTDRCGDGK